MGRRAEGEKPRRTVLSGAVDEDVAARVDEAAATEGVTRSRWVADAIRRRLDEEVRDE